MLAFGDIRPKPGAYYRQEHLFSTSTAMKSRSAHYAGVHIMRDFTARVANA